MNLFLSWITSPKPTSLLASHERNLNSQTQLQKPSSFKTSLETPQLGVISSLVNKILTSSRISLLEDEAQ